MKKKLKDLLDYEQPTKYIVETENYSDEYKLPVLTAGKSFVLGYTNETEGVFKGKNEPVIIFDDFTRDTKYVDFDFKVKSSAMKILHKHNKDDSLKYLHYALKNIKYIPFSHKRLWISDFSNMEIDYPSPEIQNTIATELDTIQFAIDNKKQQLALLDEAVKSEFVEMFGDFSEASNIQWEMKQFTEVAKIDGNMVNDFSKYADYPHIGIDSIEKNTGELKGYRTVKEDNVISGKYLFTSEHIIYSKIRPNLNKVALPTFHGVCSADAYPILVDKTKCNRYYLAYLMRSDYFLTYILAFASRAGMPKVNREQVNGFKLPLPPLDLQNKFAAFVQQIDKSKFVLYQQLQFIKKYAIIFKKIK